MSRPKIVITGMGVVCPVGIGRDAAWEGMVSGKSGAVPISRFDTEGYKTTFACEVTDFDPGTYIDRKLVKRMDLFCQLGFAAAAQAIEQSKLMEESLDRNRIGVVSGSGIGGMYSYESQMMRLVEMGPGKVSPFFIPMMIGDILAGHISIEHKLKGPNYGVVSACATASHAIGVAMMHLLAGDADVMVCGGAEAPLTQMGVAGFNSLNAISTRNDAPEKASRPFDKDRDGFVMAEGGGFFVIETEAHARKRGVEILAELGGYGFSADAYHLTAPEPSGDGTIRAMKAALESAGCEPEEVDYINAHGTSTPYNDPIETLAIKSALGDHAKKIPVSSTKSMTGHMLGATGAVELFASVQAIRTGIVPPTINLDNQDPECDLYYVPNKAEKHDVRIAMSNTLGFGGHNATLLVKKWQE